MGHYCPKNNYRKVSGSDPRGKNMNRLRLPAQGFCLILVASLLISCGVSSVSVAPTAAPTATPEPPTPTPTEGQRPKLQSDVPRISPEELKDRLDKGEAILVVDARSTSTFEFRHIAGAISVPDYEVESRLDEFPRDQEIVFY